MGQAEVSLDDEKFQQQALDLIEALKDLLPTKERHNEILDAILQSLDKHEATRPEAFWVLLSIVSISLQELTRHAVHPNVAASVVGRLSGQQIIASLLAETDIGAAH